MKKVFYYLVLAGFTIGILIPWWIGAKPFFAAGDLASDLIAISRLLGLTLAFMLALQFILIGRIKWVETVFGLDKLSRLHRTNGLIILALIIAHPLIMIFAYSRLGGVGFISQYLSFLNNDYGDIVFASFGILILLATIIWSLTIVRKRLKYEWWYYVHIFNYLAVILIAPHIKSMTSLSQYWEWPVFWILLYIFVALNMIWFRFMKPGINLWRYKFVISKVDDLGLATSVYITGRNLNRFKIEAGQFFIFRFLQEGFWTQAHPFSMSMAPNGREIRLTAKKLGDFTNELPKLKVGTQVLIDGPHGVFTEKVISKEKLLFIAGGIGITPIRSMLEDMDGRYPDEILLYSNKTPGETILSKEISDLAQKNNFRLINIYSDQQVQGEEFGRLDKNMLAKLVPDITERDIFLCGPPPMMKAVRAAMVELGVPKIQIHFERFAL